jgi:hypothetical protein
MYSSPGNLAVSFGKESILKAQRHGGLATMRKFVFKLIDLPDDQAN